MIMASTGLYVWSLVSETVWGGLGGVVLLKYVTEVGKLPFSWSWCFVTAGVILTKAELLAIPATMLWFAMDF